MTQYILVRIVGAALGLLIGVLILTIGFFKALLLAVLCALGWFLAGSARLHSWVAQICARLFHRDSDQ